MKQFVAPVVAVLAVSAIWLHGFQTGKEVLRGQLSASQARLQQQLTVLAEEAYQKETARLLLEQERDQLRRELDELAQNDPTAQSVILPAGSVLRIDSVGR
jgi:small-conductance mechanosensitive channel